jgi:hypothetical protein
MYCVVLRARRRSGVAGLGRITPSSKSFAIRLTSLTRLSKVELGKPTSGDHRVVEVATAPREAVLRRGCA